MYAVGESCTEDHTSSLIWSNRPIDAPSPLMELPPKSMNVAPDSTLPASPGFTGPVAPYAPRMLAIRPLYHFVLLYDVSLVVRSESSFDVFAGGAALSNGSFGNASASVGTFVIVTEATVVVV